MGQLINGEWSTEWYETKSTGGKFQRSTAGFRNWITRDGAPGPSGTGGFLPESGRYHLYVSYACPWAHRTLIFREIKGLSSHISVDVVHPEMLEDGWSFATNYPGATGDQLFQAPFLHNIYTRAEPSISGRVTVPILWDKATDSIVSNESSEIIRMFNSAFDPLTGNTTDYWPEGLRTEIEALNSRIYSTINNGVYKAGFATTQSAYDEAVIQIFETFEWLENLLKSNRYLIGNTITEADWRLFTTLIRFDPVYHTHFKCNRKWLREYPNLWAYTRELYQWPSIAKTVNIDHIVCHYHKSHKTINPYGIVPLNPEIDYEEPHGREAIQAIH